MNQSGIEEREARHERERVFDRPLPEHMHSRWHIIEQKLLRLERLLLPTALEIVVHRPALKHDAFEARGFSVAGARRPVAAPALATYDNALAVEIAARLYV